MSIDIEAVEYISRERGIDPAFIEKDWYAVQVLKALAEFSHDEITVIFTGGTSLSKGHGLLQRFSEDLDFRARFDTDTPPNKTKRRSFRNDIVGILKAIDGVDLDENKVDIHGLGFKIFLSYSNHFATHDCIRADLQVEFSYTQPRLGSDIKDIISFVAEYKGEEAETNILCLSPVEIAADKLSGLIWRVLKRDRASEKDDPSMIRHLYDLCALRAIIHENQELFTQTAISSFAADQERPSRSVDMALSDATKKALAILGSDGIYSQEYQQFVDEVSYADDESHIDFDATLENVSGIAELCFS